MSKDFVNSLVFLLQKMCMYIFVYVDVHPAVPLDGWNDLGFYDPRVNPDLHSRTKRVSVRPTGLWDQND